MAFESLLGRQISPATLSGEIETSVSQIFRWIAAGKIIAVKLGHRQTRIDGDSVAKFLEQQRIAPGTTSPPAGRRKAPSRGIAQV